MSRHSIFISYCRKDIRWLDRIQTHLKYLERAHSFSVWDDTKIKPGDKWREEISKAIKNAKVAILLISADFIASDFINEEELPPLLNAAESDGARIFPLIVSPCNYDLTSLSKFQTVNNPNRPLAKLPKDKREEVFKRVTQEVYYILNNNGVNLVKNQTCNIDNILERDVLKACVLNTLINKPSNSQGYTITEIVTKILIENRNRKWIVNYLFDLNQKGMVEKLKINKNTYWQLSDKGVALTTNLQDIIAKNFY